MATLLKYKKGLKRPTLAWNKMSFVTVTRSDSSTIMSDKYQIVSILDVSHWL